ncbi:hypothetical protein AVEN_204841-1 [Araneus ventricosus]|uniref:Uncharacterized protein n=1 Tax=Araneus ventricosus TaxID=182803 RepID=A0A4Y2WV76_ARAVE|nr:hypothetical protein AVEN_204841-1 [Araneus ventricosus]
MLLPRCSHITTMLLRYFECWSTSYRSRMNIVECLMPIGRASDTPSSPNENVNNLEASLESLQASARERVKMSRERMKTCYDPRATTPEQRLQSNDSRATTPEQRLQRTDHHFKEGYQVWIYNPKRRRGPSLKLQQNWEVLLSINSTMLSTE